jgi:hypothetical protein
VKGCAGVDPANAITFIENIDLDISDPIIWRKELGYAMLAGFPGYPMIFGKDFYRKPVGYGLTDVLCHFIWSHETLAVGDHVWRAAAADHLAWERMGDATSPGAVYGVTTRDSWVMVTVQTKWRNQQLHDVDGQGEDKWTDDSGKLTFWIPPDQGKGRGHCCYTVVGLENPIALKPRATAQVIQGGNGLDTPRLVNGTQVLTTVACRAGSDLSMSLTVAPTTPVAAVTLSVDGVNAWPGHASHTVRVTKDAWYEIGASAVNLPESGAPFALRVSAIPPNPLP